MVQNFISLEYGNSRDSCTNAYGVFSKSQLKVNFEDRRSVRLRKVVATGGSTLIIDKRDIFLTGSAGSCKVATKLSSFKK